MFLKFFFALFYLFILESYSGGQDARVDDGEASDPAVAEKAEIKAEKEIPLTRLVPTGKEGQLPGMM